MEKNIKRQAPLWNNGGAEQLPNAGRPAVKSERPAAGKLSRSHDLSALRSFDEASAGHVRDAERPASDRGRRPSIKPAAHSTGLRAFGPGPLAGGPGAEAKQGAIDRFAEEQIARLNAELDAAGGGVAAAIHDAPRFSMDARRPELPIANARAVPFESAVYATPDSFRTAAQTHPAPEPALHHDAMRFTPESLAAGDTLQPNKESLVEAARLGNREVLESASRQVSAIVVDLDAELRKTQLAASKILPRATAARDPGQRVAYENRIIGLREAWELAQHATRAVRRALNAAPASEEPQSATPEVQRFAEELAGQADHALTQLYQALEAVPKLPRDGAVS